MWFLILVAALGLFACKTSSPSAPRMTQPPIAMLYGVVVCEKLRVLVVVTGNGESFVLDPASDQFRNLLPVLKEVAPERQVAIKLSTACPMTTDGRIPDLRRGRVLQANEFLVLASVAP